MVQLGNQHAKKLIHNFLKMIKAAIMRLKAFEPKTFISVSNKNTIRIFNVKSDASLIAFVVYLFIRYEFGY